jgi:SAM-dependent methyltransferase
VSSAEDAREVFGRIYETAHWEGGSGQGSRADVTEPYRRVVQCLIASRDVRAVVDAGCGDWEFAQLIDWSPVEYRGIDVVPTVIDRNQTQFGGVGVRFELLDFIDAPLPSGDLLLCKDVLQHWPVALVQRFLRQVLTRYRYALLTNDIASVHCPPEARNSEIPLGAWRTLDLAAPPFDARPLWTFDYDIRGEWTKRVLLFVADRYRLRARALPGSALNRVRRSFLG